VRDRDTVVAEHKLDGLSQTPAVPSGPLRELVGCLSNLQTALKRLLALAEEKLAAMRAADVGALRDCALREDALLKQVFMEEKQRKAVLARVAQSVPCSGQERVSLTELADHLPEPLASSLRARSTALQALAEKLQQKNRVAANVAQNLQSHIRGVFAAVAKVGQETGVYGPRGEHESNVERRWIDAVG